MDAQAKNLVTPLDVDARFPNWIDRLAPDYHEDQGVALIEEAFRAVKMDCLADEQAIRRVRNTEVLRELVMFRSNLCAAENNALANPSSAAQALDIAQKLYAQRYDQLMREPKFIADPVGGGAGSQAERLAPWRR